MPDINSQKMAGEIDGDFVVFLVGMRINKLWKIHKWLPIFTAMPRMLNELEDNPDSGLLGYHTHLGIRNHMVVQYWRSFDHLREYAWQRDREHFPAIVRFYKEFASSPDTGLWHETFVVQDGQYEAVYRNMPAYGLGEAGTLLEATGRRQSAAGRLGLTEGDDVPIDEEGNVAADEYVDPIE